MSVGPVQNGTRAKLAQGGAAFGCFLRYPDAGLAEFLALRGLDFVVFDGEHGTLSPAACEHLVRAVELHGVTPAVRVGDNHAPTLLRYLDAGCLVCHVLGVASRADAERAVRAVKFHPDGERGLAPSRASGYGPRDGYASYTVRANRETQVVVHVESAAGVGAVDEIAAVDGVDVLLAGTLDLSHDLGCAGELDDPAVVAAVAAIADAAAAAGKPLGVVVSDATGAQRWLDRGARYLVTTVEALLAPSLDELLAC